MLLMLFFVNAVYQGEPKARPYPIVLHRFIYIGLALLPIYSVISFYGLSLRVDQYGWSVARCWAFLIWTLLTLFSVGYLVGILKLRDSWLQQLNMVNIAMGMVVLLSMLLVNSPILDFRKIVVASHLDQFLEGETNFDELDLQYFKNNLAGPGFDALQKLKQEHQESNPSLGVRISSIYSNRSKLDTLVSEEEFISAIEVINGEIPESLKSYLYDNESQSRSVIYSYFIKSVELNDREPLEYLMLKKTKYGNSVTLYFKQNEHWHDEYLSTQDNLNIDKDLFIDDFKYKEVQKIPSKWPDLKIGGRTFLIEDYSK